MWGLETVSFPALSEDDLQKIWAAYQALPKPVLVHCSAGIHRTGLAVYYIQKRLSEMAAGDLLGEAPKQESSTG